MNPPDYMRLALEEAKKSPPKPTNYCVGAVLLDEENDQILATGYTLEREGNTHAEQCCFIKLAEKHGLAEKDLAEVLPPGTVLYTTMEPCTERLSGNLPCAQRILRLSTDGKGIRKVYTGVQEPATFVFNNSAKAQLEAVGIEYKHVPGLEHEILAVATAGHKPA